MEKIILQCVSWRESITEQTEDISFIKNLSLELNTRKDLWKYYEVAYQHIKDWKNTPIKKVGSRKKPFDFFRWILNIECFCLAECEKSLREAELLGTRNSKHNKGHQQRRLGMDKLA